MDDLRQILAGRSAFYSKADLRWTPAPSPCNRPSACAGPGARGLKLPVDRRRKFIAFR
jgi:hypothetical protein